MNSILFINKNLNNKIIKKFPFDTDLMSAEEVRSFIDKGLDDIDKGKVVKAKKFFEDFRSTHKDD